MERGAAGGALLGGADRGDQGGRQAVATADNREADAGSDQSGGFAAQVAREQPHERGDLGGWPLPVVAGEGVEGEGADVLGAGGLDHPAYGAGAGVVAGCAREAAA